MKKLILALSVLCFTSISAFSQGINFKEGTWAEVVAQAKKDKKPIFIDLYATWCGPCKMMAKNVFTDNEVGEVFNKAFVSYKVDAEKGEGITLAKKFGLKGYPTFIFIDPSNEKEIHRVMGAMPAANFIKEAETAIQKANK